MKFTEAYDKIEFKFGKYITPYIILVRAVSIPNVHATEQDIFELTKQKLKEDNTHEEIEKLSKILYKRYKTPESLKMLNYQNYL